VRHHLLRPVAVAAGLTVGVAICAAGGTAAAGAAAHPAAATASVASATVGTRPVFLINGDQLDTSTASAAASCVTFVTLAARAGTAGPMQTLSVGGRTYAIPDAAMPYLGRGLDPSLFDLTAVVAAESDGRLPVRVHYSGQLPSLPGVTITQSSDGVATGYLTAAGATSFGAALASQLGADRAHGSYGQEGLFAGGLSLSLADAAPAAPRPKFAMQTVTVTGTNRVGQPDNGDTVWLFNADNSTKFDDPQSSQGTFSNGIAKFSVPAGHYWALGDFVNLIPKHQTWDEYLDVLPQFSVTKGTTVHVGAQAATSQIQAVTSKPAIEQYSVFQLIRSAAAGPAVSVGWIESDGGPKIPAPSLYISPTQASPTVGKLATVTSEQLGTSAFPPGSRYLYGVAFHSSGTIPAQRHVINQASLATVHLRYYSAARSDGLLGTFPAFPIQNVCPLGAAIFSDAQFPMQQTEYLSASPSLSWESQYILNGQEDYSGGQVGAPQAYLPGEHVTDDLGAYPLHPAPNVRLSDIPGLPPVQASASRAGNTLRLALTAFSDSVPGHVGQGTFPPVKTVGSYEIDQNGTKIAGGTVAHFYGPFAATATLSPSPSVVKFTLNAAESSKLNPLSTASQTVWTWRSAAEPGSTLPPGWTCLPGGQPDRACAVQPMMTLRYGVVGMGLTGSTSAGQQVVRVTVGHLQLAKAAKITGAAVSVSFDGGKTWQAASVAGSGGRYAAVFSAPAGALVTLRTSATDAAGGSVAETITNAYQVES
jgi:hypothetical protein